MIVFLNERIPNMGLLTQLKHGSCCFLSLAVTQLDLEMRQVDACDRHGQTPLFFVPDKE